MDIHIAIIEVMWYNEQSDKSKFVRIIMDFELLPLEQADIDTFKHDIQEAF